jgi:hypothetical protein
MEKTVKQKIMENLFSPEENIVLESLEKVKNDGDQLMLKAILELMISSKSENVQNKIFEILSILKDIKSPKTIIEAIKNPKYNSYFKKIATTIWMSGLDYGEYLDIFVEKFISEELYTAFEAFTIIENTDYPGISDEMFDIMISKLENSKDKISEEKKQLYFDLFNIIETKKEEKNQEKLFNETDNENQE